MIIIGYNMARELPRTILSLSPSMQRGIAASAYELLVVDNGSFPPVDERQLAACSPNLRVLRPQAPHPSPIAAIHLGLDHARGDMVAVCIDGARMVSPGLLAQALLASRQHPKPVIGTIGFHLGPKVQARSINEGYSKEVEDRLLAECRWEEDAYRLFRVSSLASSSRHGWFALPSESNAIFLKRSHWRDMDGGYDIRFVSPGGGLANLDLWARLATDPSTGLIMLLGEATFHQIHGGVSTNAARSPWADFEREYAAIRGHRFERIERRPLFFGELTTDSARHMPRQRLNG